MHNEELTQKRGGGGTGTQTHERSCVSQRSLWTVRASTKQSIKAFEDTWLVSWCFKPSQPKRIISGLRETFIKRHIVERTNKAEIRREEQTEKAESCW